MVNRVAQFSRGAKKKALTLTELVVVIAVIVVLTAITVPLVQPVVKGRDAREGGRQLNVFLAAAQTRAMELGRPVGIWLVKERIGNDIRSTRIHMAEVPPPYSGEFADSRARIETYDGVTTVTFGVDSQGTFTDGLGADAVAPPIVNLGDQIQFDHKGPLFTITAIEPGVSVIVTLPKNPLYVPPPMPSASYQIYRRPRKKAAAPLVLQNGIAVEMAASGFGVNGIEFGATVGEEVVIMFNPDGTVESIYPNGVNPATVTDLLSLNRVRPPGTINFLVGRLEQDSRANLLDTNNLWVSVGHRSGSITIAPNASIATAFDPQDPVQLSGAVAEARQISRTKQGMGGL